MSIKKILITGGAGFVGSNLAIFLKNDNHSWDIISLDNLHRRGSELNVQRLSREGVDFVHGDIRIIDDIEQIGEFDLLIECSAEPSVLSGYDGSPTYLCQTNLLGTLNCLEICRRRKGGIIFLSTSRVYPINVINNLNYVEEKTRFNLGKNQVVPGVSELGLSEDFPITGVRSLYGATKLCSELMIQEYINAYGIKGVINRCGVISGPWQMGKVDQGFAALWVARHLWKGDLSYIGYGGNGKQVRDILHIKDLYDLLCIQIERIDEMSGSVFNVGGGKEFNISLCELTKMCQDITGNKISIASTPGNREMDIPYYVSDYRKVQEITGWKPRLDIKKNVCDIYSWLREYETILKPIFG